MLRKTLFYLSLAAGIFAMTACSGSSQATADAAQEAVAQELDSLTNEMDAAIQDIKSETEAVKNEVDDLLEDIDQ